MNKNTLFDFIFLLENVKNYTHYFNKERFDKSIQDFETNLNRLKEFQKELWSYIITVKCISDYAIGLTKDNIYTILSCDTQDDYLVYLVKNDNSQIIRYHHKFFDEPIFTKIEK